MKINFEAVLKDLDGADLADPDKQVLTLKKVSVNALLGFVPQDSHIDGTEKMKRYVIAKKIQRGVSKLQAEEVSLLKQLIGRTYGTVVVGPAYDILEGNDEEVSLPAPLAAVPAQEAASER